MAHAAVDHSHSEELSKSINALDSVLGNKNIDTNRFNSCARNQEGFGRSPKHCSLGIEITTTLRTEYIEAAKSFMNALGDSNKFQSVTKTVSLSDLDNLSIYHGVDYVHVPTGSKCGIVYEYVEESKEYKIQFSCDDTSWFVRTFEG